MCPDSTDNSLLNNLNVSSTTSGVLTGGSGGFYEEYPAKPGAAGGPGMPVPLAGPEPVANDPRDQGTQLDLPR
jgi:hypothetical protein